MNTVNHEQLKELLSKQPRIELGFFPTPLYYLKNASKELGINLYLKRDDLTGPSVFGGNKIRKLEYLIGDALEKGAEYIFTYGATQSNHAMQTVTACRKCGLHPLLYLVAVVPPKEGDFRSNLLLDMIMGAEIHVTDLVGGMTQEDGNKKAQEEADKRKEQLVSDGKKYYDIPIGGSSREGALGFIHGFMEAMLQVEEQNIGNIDYIFHASGSGGTLAGLIAGIKALNSHCELYSVLVSHKSDEYKDKVVNLANQSLNLLGIDPLVSVKDLNLLGDYVGEGYEIPTKAASEAIKFIAKEEGILLDPVYTGKGMSGLIDLVNKGKVPKGSNVIFWHTGGGTGLFAENEIVGDIF
ncbi:D-cysteine desulfhydrase family protein [Clostridium sp. Cult2]|uniref:D-cysteine desulfhydrase family protein n=1 Tax=Clostridium sp. Cult2 TaxID=2079003 RepID=UPI001F1F5AE0